MHLSPLLHLLRLGLLLHNFLSSFYFSTYLFSLLLARADIRWFILLSPGETFVRWRDAVARETQRGNVVEYREHIATSLDIGGCP